MIQILPQYLRLPFKRIRQCPWHRPAPRLLTVRNSISDLQVILPVEPPHVSHLTTEHRYNDRTQDHQRGSGQKEAECMSETPRIGKQAAVTQLHEGDVGEKPCDEGRDEVGRPEAGTSSSAISIGEPWVVSTLAMWLARSRRRKNEKSEDSGNVAKMMKSQSRKSSLATVLWFPASSLSFRAAKWLLIRGTTL